MRRAFDPSKPIQSIRSAASITGLSEHYLRTAIKTGKLPFLQVGRDCKVHMPTLLKFIESQLINEG